MESLWSSTTEGPVYSSKTLDGDIKTDVLIVGGGLAGILCAYKLKLAGVKCIVVEKNRIGSGVTKNTTAKVTAQHGIKYAHIIEEYGADQARQYFDANQRAVEELRSLASEFPCDFEDKTAYVYARNSLENIERESNAYKLLEIPHHITSDTPLPFEVKAALGIENQGQFNPLKLIYGLAQHLDIYENTLVTEIKENKAITDKGTIKADKIILTTHYPMVNIPGFYFMKLYQERSYAIALKNTDPFEGMYIGDDVGFSFRSYKDYLLIGGGNHRTGEGPGEEEGYSKLRELARSAYPNREEVFAMATQDCMSLDGLPYIGVHRPSAPDLFTVSGFNKWGMTNSMVAALLCTDLIQEKENPWTELFSPERSVLHLQLFSNAIESTVNLLRPGKRCSHLGCHLEKNELENSWDCPCHGSRFDKDGQVLDNPAIEPIKA